MDHVRAAESGANPLPSDPLRMGLEALLYPVGTKPRGIADAGAAALRLEDDHEYTKLKGKLR